MTRDSLQEFDRNPNLDTDIAGINVAPGWSPSSVGPAFRQMMSQLANYSIPFGIAVSGGVTLSDAQASGTLINTSGTGGTLTIPARASWGWLWNSCTGPVTITTGTGITRAIPTGLTAFWYCYDGVNIASPTFDVALGTLPSLAVTGAITAASLGVTGSVTAGGNIQGNQLFSSTNVFANNQISSPNGNVGVVPAAGAGGGAYLAAGGANPGYVAFTNSAGTRVGYVGYTDGGVNHVLQPEGTYTGWTCAGNFQVNAALYTAGQSMTVGTTYFGNGGQFFAAPNWGGAGNAIVNFAGGQYIIFTNGVGFDYVTGGRHNFTGPIVQGGVQVCLNNGGTWSINITGSAGFANTAGSAPANGGHASTADFATNASHASTADFATNAGHASTADGAGSVGWGGVSGVPGQVGSLNQFVNTDSSVTHNSLVLNSGGAALVLPNGAAFAAGGFNPSDRRVKRNIRDIEADEALKWVRDGRPRHATLEVGDESREMGCFIAQEDIAAGRPELVKWLESDDPRVAVADEHGKAGQRAYYDSLPHIAYLTRALQHYDEALTSALQRIAALEELVTK